MFLFREMVSGVVQDVPGNLLDAHREAFELQIHSKGILLYEEENNYVDLCTKRCGLLTLN